MNPATLTFTAASPQAVSDVRRVLTRELTRWACGRTDDAVLVFSELVTNAVKHAGGATSIVVVHGDETLHIEVRDGARAEPVVRDDDRPGGFGLRIVAELSQRWGWSLTELGKVVWCDLPCCVGDDQVTHA